jgi:hypothetical protein
MTFDLYTARHFHNPATHRQMGGQDGRPYLITRHGSYRTYEAAESAAHAVHPPYHERGSNFVRASEGSYDYLWVGDDYGMPVPKPEGAAL